MVDTWKEIWANGETPAGELTEDRFDRNGGGRGILVSCELREFHVHFNLEEEEKQF